MDIQDAIVNSRNKLINSLIRVDSSLILNPVVPEKRKNVEGQGLPGKIIKVLDQLKDLVIDEVGNHVDYSALTINKVYEDYVDLVAQLHHFDLNLLGSKSNQLAFWINLYNAITLDTVIQVGVSKSITEGFFGIFSFFERAAYQINGHRFSLNDIEHGILRVNKGFPYFFGPHFGPGDQRNKWIIPTLDPRVHFALNCASKSCPPIRFYKPEHINTQLTMASRNFVSQNISVDFDRNVLSLSSIFRWYKDDFGGKRGVLRFIKAHLPNDDRKSWLHETGESVHLIYQKYDWDLNRVE